jgi:hypothetical protein
MRANIEISRGNVGEVCLIRLRVNGFSGHDAFSGAVVFIEG